jgi:hypothetical protein
VYAVRQDGVYAQDTCVQHQVLSEACSICKGLTESQHLHSTCHVRHTGANTKNGCVQQMQN